jgi:hypothetical protein
MRPLKLTIPGEYWDTQIYRGKLYLFERSGSIRTLDWDQAIEHFDVGDRLKLPLMCAFQRSDYLYRVVATGFLYDPEFRDLMSQRFAALEDTELELTARDIEKFQIGHQDNPFPFPHADTTIYKRRLYTTGRSGVTAASCDSGTKYPISTKPSKLLDAPSLVLRASYDSLALALGEDGLWEYQLNSYGSADQLYRLSSNVCTDCHWMFYSIYGSSHHGGFLAQFARDKLYESPREFKTLLSEEEVFGRAKTQPRYSWGRQDKLYQSVNGKIRVAKYQPWLADEKIRSLGELTLASHEGLVAADVGLFGMILELPSHLLVLASSGDVEEIDGEPVSWRIFVRSRHYENHLHVIYDDHLSILSFNNDYLVDQKAKLAGIYASVNTTDESPTHSRGAG